MDGIIWKCFTLGSLFELSGCHKVSKTAKQYNPVSEPREGYIANVTAGKFNEGIANYLPIDEEINEKKICNYLTIASNGDGGAGTCFYHDYDFVSTGHNAVLLYKNDALKDIIVSNKECALFFASMITKVFANGIFNQTYAVTKDNFPREIICLPCIEVQANENYVWQEQGRFFTLAINYIKSLMNQAKEFRERKTIRLYEFEKEKLELERAKFADLYNRERSSVVWKSFKLGDLFSWSSRKDLSLKNYNSVNEYQEGFVEVVTGSKTNDNSYIAINDLPDDYPIYSDCLCLNTNGSIGYCIYYDCEIISPTSSVHVLLHKSKDLKNLMSKEINGFLSKIITRIFTTGFYSRTACLISEEKFNRETIMLPCIEVKKGEEFIWEDDEKRYTLASNYISYLYLSGRIKYNQKLIDEYSYQY